MPKIDVNQVVDSIVLQAIKCNNSQLDLAKELHALEQNTRGEAVSLPESLRGFKNLRLLTLRGVRLRELPSWIGELNRLEILDLTDCDLVNLPENLDGLQSLKVLDITGNKLKVLPNWICRLKNLNELKARINRLEVLPSEIGNLNRLQLLWLGRNRLMDLPDSFRNLLQLGSLDLDNNSFDFIPKALYRLRNLVYLDFEANNISEVHPDIGRLNKLIELRLAHNRIKNLPAEIGRLKDLSALMVAGNPLPAEILRLADDNRLILYYASLLKKGGLSSLKHFNEAKLLLLGPGEVGKTWLLQALKGVVPEDRGATKGLEIARVPFDVDHPSQDGRVIHLNCWDFGGQENYQITHQIFFSPKAIYLLVWKPRPGADPDLISRLERIQLSAGETAKVFIVSTHADSNVPAVIGRDAIRERFGDLIHGFFAIDSKKGSQGTGIANLKDEIAKAAANLEGMDTPFPSEWHDAQKAVRRLKRTTLNFRDFSKICISNGMNSQDCESLASIMDVLGNAVFFSEASKSVEAGVAEEDNLVVLDPEWLAKSVAFVIEDEDTQNSSGILVHKYLRDIWRKDPRRNCPGYRKDLFGYLLWMMWKFDIAYKQNELVSLLPELIQRNRPDDLRWTPSSPSVERQATLVCRVPQTPPAGLIPVLTAAVHPLRRLQNHDKTDDRLDRNWRDGFFLDTARRGTAFVELIDRDLRITVRDAYPSDLARQIRRTLDRIISARWPRLEIDYCVPCVGRIRKGDPCPGVFKLDYLESRRSKQVSCQSCYSDNLEVDRMLEGFDSDTEKVMGLLRDLKVGQSDLMTLALRLYREVLDPSRSELERAPCMFTILPEDAKAWNLVGMATENRVRVTCWCEHPDGPHPAVAVGSDQPPDYLLKVPKGWVIKVAPYISWAATLLKAFVPLAGTVIQQGSEGGSSDLKASVELMGDASKALPAGKLDIGKKEELDPASGYRPEIVGLRHIHDALIAQVSEQRRWGSLRPIRTKTGELLWLCAEHAAIQQPPVQSV